MKKKEREAVILEECKKLAKRIEPRRKNQKRKPNDQKLAEDALIWLENCYSGRIRPPHDLLKVFSYLLEDPRQPRVANDPNLNVGAHLSRKLQQERASSFGIRIINLAKLDKAIDFEASQSADPHDLDPSTAKPKKVADFAGVDEKTIIQWRRHPKYQFMVKATRKGRGV